MFQLRDAFQCPVGMIFDPISSGCVTTQAPIPTLPSGGSFPSAIFMPTVPGTVPGTVVTTPTPGTQVITTMPPAGPFGPGWYKTPFGIILILGGLFVGYKLYKRKQATA